MTDRTIGDFGFPSGGGGAPDDAPVYVISIAATLAGMHPQTLRQYDRLRPVSPGRAPGRGRRSSAPALVSPGRAPGRGRRYSARDIVLLREVQRLSQDEGINLAGIKRILELENHVAALRARVAELQAGLSAAADEMARREQAVHASYRRDLVPV